MVFPKARMVVAAILFLGWIGFLVYLVTQSRDPIVLSRPQLLVADAVALVKIQEDDKRSHVVVKLLTPDSLPTPAKIENLDLIAADQGWRGPGEYIVPLSKRAEAYSVTTLPPVPGYVPLSYTVRLTQFGPNAEAVKAKLADFAKKLPEESSKDVNRLPLVWQLPRTKDALGRPVPNYNETYALFDDLKRLGADVEIIGEPRIYLAVPAALRDLESIKQTK